ncbi:MAG: hypothetical protein HGA67_02405 [Candidatus Yonathbacteria bacterium]|nr:hypothetical protein [Candidatus Yonathbacteria bacterium]
MRTYTSTQAGVYTLICALISALTGGYAFFEISHSSLLSINPVAIGLAIGLSIFFGLITIALIAEYAILRMKDT